ncbi:uncharacterized protein A4U43_C02F17460 [Asparagus officinalis]|uniref:Uncharacterized protein n=1 Tax=Asparagus officinalis TaxID=4686 RepID=A0A5P1FJS3_ASPOF|nr:uncharacterized protein A4U43_C02F17460 [Asparagus officinalis]
MKKLEPRQIALANEGGLSVHRSESSCQGKEPIMEEMAPPTGLEYPYPHRVAEIGEEWDRMRGVDSERATETPAPRAFEINGLTRELDESNRNARRLDKSLQERDRAKV